MSSPEPAENRLAHETSPYLLQHKDNPVDWMPWGEEAFERARNQDKPILLSIGYAACHWCHVMAHESFENPEIARLMNGLFVNIKVDREERPDLDHIYQSALALLGQHGGWPLTMFLTPDGAPFWGGTYFPPADRYGRPGFPEVLREIARAYAEEPDSVARNVEALRSNLQELARNRPGTGLSLDVLDLVSERLVQEVDPVHGGIGSAPKFPQCGILSLFWRAWQRSGQSAFHEAVVNTLVHMSQGGIYDHLGGGFARYATDERWLVPHFEKMLYDNAQLIELLMLVWQETKEPLFRIRVHETAEWLLREMTAAPNANGDTGFASTLDADSEGEEGRFYVWTETEVDRLLGAASSSFKLVYDVSTEGNWDGVTILNRLHCLAVGSAADEAVLADQRSVLLQARESRPRPAWDDKVLTDWNGLAIAALAHAGRAFRNPHWVDRAKSAFAFVTSTLNTADGRLHHSWRNGTAKQAGFLDDYAAMSRAALTLFEVTGLPEYLTHARTWVDQLALHFWDRTEGGFFLSADDSGTLLIRPKTIYDNATPAGNGMALECLARLWHLTGERRYRDRADALISAFTGEISRNIFPLATFLNAFELLEDPLLIVVIGARGTPQTEALLDTIFDCSLPSRILLTVTDSEPLPAPHPASGKTQVDANATAYICRGTTCSAPITDPSALRPLLADSGVRSRK